MNPPTTEAHVDRIPEEGASSIPTDATDKTKSDLSPSNNFSYQLTIKNGNCHLDPSDGYGVDVILERCRMMLEGKTYKRWITDTEEYIRNVDRNQDTSIMEDRLLLLRIVVAFRKGDFATMKDLVTNNVFATQNIEAIKELYVIGPVQYRVENGGVPGGRQPQLRKKLTEEEKAHMAKIKEDQARRKKEMDEAKEKFKRQKEEEKAKEKEEKEKRRKEKAEANEKLKIQKEEKKARSKESQEQKAKEKEEKARTKQEEVEANEKLKKEKEEQIAKRKAELEREMMKKKEEADKEREIYEKKIEEEAGEEARKILAKHRNSESTSQQKKEKKEAAGKRKLGRPRKSGQGSKTSSMVDRNTGSTECLTSVVPGNGPSSTMSDFQGGVTVDMIAEIEDNMEQESADMDIMLDVSLDVHPDEIDDTSLNSSMDREAQGSWNEERLLDAEDEPEVSNIEPRNSVPDQERPDIGENKENENSATAVAVSSSSQSHNAILGNRLSHDRKIEGRKFSPAESGLLPSNLLENAVEQRRQGKAKKQKQTVNTERISSLRPRPSKKKSEPVTVAKIPVAKRAKRSREQQNVEPEQELEQEYREERDQIDQVLRDDIAPYENPEVVLDHQFKSAEPALEQDASFKIEQEEQKYSALLAEESISPSPALEYDQPMLPAKMEIEEAAQIDARLPPTAAIENPGVGVFQPLLHMKMEADENMGVEQEVIEEMEDVEQVHPFLENAEQDAPNVEVPAEERHEQHELVPADPSLPPSPVPDNKVTMANIKKEVEDDEDIQFVEVVRRQLAPRDADYKKWTVEDMADWAFEETKREDCREAIKREQIRGKWMTNFLDKSNRAELNILAGPWGELAIAAKEIIDNNLQ